jgi:Domain of unknown function (DUF4037)
MSSQPPADGPGLRLGRALFDEVIAPAMARHQPHVRYDAALIGASSEVLGYDTERSTDHDYGARVQLFLTPGDPAAADVDTLLDDAVPDTFHGHPTRFHRARTGGVRRQVILTDIAAWSRTELGVDASGPLDAIDWLAVPTQLFASATRGAVYHDGLGEVTAMRARLAFYPDDVWRYLLAGQWQRIGQEEHFVGRTGEVGDDLGSAVVAARLVRDIVRLTLLLRRRYPPYAKWLGTAFADLPDAPRIGPHLTAALRAADWRSREHHLSHAYTHVAAVQNATGLTEPLDTATRPFHDRPFQVIGAERFTNALRASITDPAVAALPMIGAIDQVADSTEVLSDAGRAVTVAHALLRP